MAVSPVLTRLLFIFFVTCIVQCSERSDNIITNTLSKGTICINSSNQSSNLTAIQVSPASNSRNMSSVLVFGPTGKVGSIVARAAAAHGSKVWLAMRDTSKTIPSLSAESGKKGQFERIQADLTVPQSISAAVKTSQAKRAFIYLAHGSTDHMKSALQALRSGGIECVVFLSSFTIQGEAREVEPSQVIPYIHARVEMNLEEIFGDVGFVAIRAGTFVTNLVRYKSAILETGQVAIFGPHWETDAITPIDVGEASGTILAKGSSNNQRIVYLFGPQLIEQAEFIRKMARALGKDVVVTEIEPKDALKNYLAGGMSKALAEYLVSITDRSKEEVRRWRARYEEGVQNVRVYTGREPISVDTWIKENIHPPTSQKAVGHEGL